MGAFISEPNVTLNIIPAQLLATVAEQKVLIVGQMLAAGTATAGQLYQDFPNDGSEDTLFSRRSHIAGMIREFKKLNKVTQLDVIALDDAGAAVKGTAIVTLTSGPSTADATIIFVIGSEKNHEYELDTLTGDTVTDIGDALVAAITADLDAPFTAANVAGIVTITAENAGTLSDGWDIKVDDILGIPGVDIALTGWTGGATDPTLTTLFDPIANIRYQTICWPGVWDMETVSDFLDTRFNLTNDIKDGRAVQIVPGTLASLKSYVATVNSQSMVVNGTKTVATLSHIGNSTPEMPDVICSQICALRSLRLTQDANLTQYLTTVAPDDQFGGPELGSLPYFNTALPNLPISNIDDFFESEELDELRDNGVSVFGPNKAFNNTIFGEQVTTYLTDNAGNPDASYKFLNTVDAASIIREFFSNNYRVKYAQTRLTDGDLIARRDMANAGSIRAFTNKLYDELADDTLVQAGSDAKKDFNDQLVITINILTGTATVNAAPLLVTQLRAVLGTIQINFGV